MRGDDLKMLDPGDPKETGLLSPDGTAGKTGPILESWAWALFLGPARPAASSEAFVSACSRSS